MATKRTVDTGMWTEDPWFQDLDPSHKLVFMYLFTSPLTSACGTIGASVKTISDHTGMSKAMITKILPLLAQKVMWWPEINLIFVRNFYRRQNFGAGYFQIAAYNAAQRLPDIVREAVVEEYPELDKPGHHYRKKDSEETEKEYPIDRVSIPHQYPINTPLREESESVSVSESVSESVSVSETESEHIPQPSASATRAPAPEAPLRRFVPPTREQVDAYRLERGKLPPPETDKFIDYHGAANWILRNGRQMVDWRSAWRTWEAHFEQYGHENRGNSSRNASNGSGNAYANGGGQRGDPGTRPSGVSKYQGVVRA